MKNKERILWMSLCSLLAFITFFPTQKAKAISTEAEKLLQVFHEVSTLIQTDFVESTEEKKLYIGAIRGMISSLGDPHTRFLDEDEFKQLQEETRGSFGGVGIEVTQTSDGQLLVVTPIDDTPAMRAGIQPQDKIIEINGNPTEKMNINEAVKLMRGTVGSSVTIKIKRKNLKEPLTFTLNRELIKIQFIKSEFVEDKKIGYLRISQFMGKAETLNEYRSILKSFLEKGMQGLIIDLRSNPGGLLDLAIDLSDIFLSDGKEIVSVKGRGNKLEKIYTAQNFSFKILDLPLVILMNNGSASASEIFAGAMQDHSRGIVIGTQSFGKGSVQHIYPLSHKTGIALTIQKYYTPNGTSIHKKGISPNIVVNPIAPEEEERVYVEKIFKDQLVSEFVKLHPDYTEQTQELWLKKLESEGIKIRPILAKYLLKREATLGQKTNLIDLEFDPQLAKAFEVLAQKK
jgi:carboxyl-terminal processing protease